MITQAIGRVNKTTSGWVIYIPKKYAELLGLKPRTDVLVTIENTHIPNDQVKYIELDDEPR